MAKKRKKIDMHQGPTLLDFLRDLQATQHGSVDDAEGCMDIKDGLRRALNRAICHCRLSRYEIAGRMSHLLGVDVSKSTMDAWTAESKDGHRIPAEYLPVFCKVTGDLEPLRIIAEKAGMFAMPGPEALRAEIQKYTEQESKARAEKRKRILFLEEMEECGGR